MIKFVFILDISIFLNIILFTNKSIVITRPTINPNATEITNAAGTLLKYDPKGLINNGFVIPIVNIIIHGII